MKSEVALTKDLMDFEEIQNLSDDWVVSSISVAKGLYKALGRNTYSFHRGSEFVDMIENLFKNSGQAAKLNRLENKHRNVL